MNYLYKFLFLSLFFFQNYTYSQDIPTFSPFNGIHFGYTGQLGIVEKCETIQLIGVDNPIIPLNTLGYQIGLECSFNFAKFYGISIGLEFGTISSLNYKKLIPNSLVGLGEDVFEENLWNISFNRLTFPLKLDFHFPISKHLYFNSNIGVRFKNLGSLLRKNSSNMTSYMIIGDGFLNNLNQPLVFYEAIFYPNIQKFGFDYIMTLGFYYKLPYLDLLRINFGLNISKINDIIGYYNYPISNSFGMFIAKNNQITMQISYIHTFEYLKAKKYIRYTSDKVLNKKELKEKVNKILKF